MHGRPEYVMIGLLLFGISSATVFGQAEVRTFYLKDGSTLQGRIVAQDDSTLLVETQYGTLDIQRRNIVRQELAKQLPAQPRASETQTVYLRDGSTLKGVIEYESEDSLKIQTPYGTMTIPQSSVKQVGGTQPMRRQSELPAKPAASVPVALNDMSRNRDDSCTYCIAHGGGAFLRLNLVNNGVGGEFDGKSILYSTDEIFLLPQVENSFGFGVALGMGTDWGKLELGYVRSQHNVSFSTAQGKSIFNMINLDFNIYVISKTLIRPYVMFGLCVPWIVVKEGSATIESNPRVGDESFSGIGFNIGPGLELFIHNDLMIDAEIVFRRIRYGSVSGVRNEDREYEEGLNGSGASVNVGFSYFFALMK